MKSKVSNIYSVQQVFPGNRYSLFELAEWKNGLAFKKIDFSDSGIPVIKIAELNRGLTESTAYTQGIYDEQVSLKKGDLLFSWSGNPDTSIDVFKFPLEAGWLNQHIFKVTENPSILTKDFLFYLLKYLKPNFCEIARNKQTTGLGHVTIRDLKQFYVTIPPLPIQRKIVSILSSLDEKISVNLTINDNLDKIARLLYKDIFTCEDSNIDECKLSDIAFITMGQSPSGSSYNETHDGEVFYQGRTDFGVRFPTRRLFTSEPKRIADEGDILLSVRAPVGDLNIATERCCIGRGLSALRSKEGNQSYLFYTLLSIEDQLNLFNSEGTVFGAINKDSLGNLAIKIHPLEKIRVFESTVQPLDNLIRSNYFEVCKLQLLRDSLLPKLMSGEIDVSDVEI